MTRPCGASRKNSPKKKPSSALPVRPPFGPYAQEVRQIAPTKLGRLKPQDSVRLAGFVTAVRTMMGKRGKIAFVSLEDLSGQIEIMVSGQTLENCADYLKSDQVLIIESKVSRDDYGGGDGLRIMANQVMTCKCARTLRPQPQPRPRPRPRHRTPRRHPHRPPPARHVAHPTATVVQQRQSIGQIENLRQNGW